MNLRGLITGSFLKRNGKIRGFLKQGGGHFFKKRKLCMRRDRGLIFGTLRFLQSCSNLVVVYKLRLYMEIPKFKTKKVKITKQKSDFSLYIERNVL